MFQHRFVPTLEREAELKIFALKRFYQLWALILVASLLLAGCATAGSSPVLVEAEPGVGSAPAGSAAMESVPAEADPGDTVAAEADTPTENDIPEESVSPTESASPDESTEAISQPDPRPTARAELHASDPSGVKLAAGKPQLVEFFAFW
jgi:hypothetical protein